MLTAALLPLLLVAAVDSDDVDVEAGLGEGVTVKVGDDFRFQVRGRAQVRAEGEASADTEASFGFQVRRLRLTLNGDALHKQFGWNVQLAFAPRDIERDNPSVMRDANVSWNLSKPLRLRFGQMKVPFDRQRITSSANLQFPERSTAVNELTLDRDVGIVAFSAPLADLFSYQVGVFGGDGRARLNEDLGLLLSARVQFTPLGAFDDDLVEGDVAREADARMAVALGVAFNQGSPRALSTTGTFDPDNKVDFAHATADVLFKANGISLMAAGLARVATGSAVDGAVARSAVGLLGQAGVMVNEHIEFVGRYAHIEPVAPLNSQITRDASLVAVDEGRAGVNVYVFGHDLKLANDIGVVVEAGAAPVVDGHVMAQIAF
jgi:phosphate-selective porin OprO/OprP